MQIKISPKNNQNILEMYNKLEKKRSKYAKLKKGVIHFHSPGSYDYELIKGKKYKELSTLEILKFANEIGYLEDTQYEKLVDSVKKGELEGEDYLTSLKDNQIPYSSFSEYISYMILAYKLYLEENEYAILTDHNTIEGYHKLEFALNKCFQEKFKSKFINKKNIYLFLGVEISCSDNVHIVGIFDQSKIVQVEKLLDDIIYNKESGTIEPALSVLNKIRDLHGIGYIAHVNSYKGVGTGLYKEILFSSENTSIIGTKNLLTDSWKTHLPESLKSNIFKYIHECDSHNIEDLSSRNTWIKMNEINFNTLNKAIVNYNTSIYTTKPEVTSKFIKGLILESKDKDAFLINKSEDNLIIDFSKDLNCIIGGRGTGKSTILNILDTVISSQVKDMNTLKFISKYSSIHVVFRIEDSDYVIRFLPQINEQLFKVTDTEKLFRDSKSFRNDENIIYLTKNWTQLFIIKQSDEEQIAEEITITQEKDAILQRFYKKHFSINSLVHKIDNNKIGDFIRTVIYDGITEDFFSLELENLYKMSTSRFLNSISGMLIKIDNKLKSIQYSANIQTEEFNKLNKDILKIIYSPQDIQDDDLYINELFTGFKRDSKIKNTLLKGQEIIDFSAEIINKIGLIEFLRNILTKKFNKLEQIISIENFISANYDIKAIQQGTSKLSAEKIQEIYTHIFLFFKNNKNNIVRAVEKYIYKTDDFTIEFNINTKQTSDTPPTIFKPINQLSLGQKVVALLTFIINYGFYKNDSTPFIIDQPEDNLDNQYIYNTLIASLKNIKNTRQVIVVTHNSNIVSNADAENVLVLESDGINGTIKKTGYSSDQKIIKEILFHLEGGVAAFINKTHNYSAVISKS